MTDEDIARIRGRSPQARYLMRDGALTTEASHDMSRLLAEVERLRNREHASQVADRPQALEAAEREHDRWMAEHAALRAIAQKLATEDWLAYEGDAGDDIHCPGCAGEEADWRTQPKDLAAAAWHDWRWQHYQHTPECPVTKARALLASEG